MKLNYRLWDLGGGVPCASPLALRFVPRPKTTLALSAGTGVPSFDVSTSAATDTIRENPGRGAGEPPADTAGLPLLGMGAGSVMNPVESSCGIASLSACFFLFFFSVLPLVSGWLSRNSVACGTAL